MRRAIVTGGASGLGSDMASALISAGYQVGVMDIDREQTEATASRLGNAIPLVASVSDNAAVEAAFAQFGEAPDLLINNAGRLNKFCNPIHIIFFLRLYTTLPNFVTGFCLILSEFVIVLHNILPTTNPFADFKEAIVLSVIPKPITRFFLGFILLILL